MMQIRFTCLISMTALVIMFTTLYVATPDTARAVAPALLLAVLALTLVESYARRKHRNDRTQD